MRMSESVALRKRKFEWINLKNTNIHLPFLSYQNSDYNLQAVDNFRVKIYE